MLIFFCLQTSNKEYIAQVFKIYIRLIGCLMFNFLSLALSLSVPLFLYTYLSKYWLNQVEDLFTDLGDGRKLLEIISLSLGLFISHSLFLSLSLCLSFYISLWSLLEPGGGSVHRPGGRAEAAEAAGDHLRREAGETQQRQDESPQGWECQQKSGLPSYKGKVFFHSQEVLF